MSIMVFCVVTLSEFVGRIQRFGEKYCLRYQSWYLPGSPHHMTAGNTEMDDSTAVRTSYLTIKIYTV
jgi:hypothetical protein